MNNEELREKFTEAYQTVIQEAPADLVNRCNTSLTWEQDTPYPHIDHNLIKGLPEPIINKIVELYEHLRLKDF